MKRKQFIQTIAVTGMAGALWKLQDLARLTDQVEGSDRMPVLFLGHGSPMNAIEENEFVRGFRDIGSKLPTPKGIVCVSAHWETKGTFVTAMEHPKTIHDFGGFPQALFDVRYPAPGSPALAAETQKTVTSAQIGLDQQWGLDHGCWSVVKHLYPKADIPVIQLSLDYTKPASYHYTLAKELASLRRKGILIVGSGNMVHNLRMVAWDKLNTDSYGFDWAIEASDRMKSLIRDKNHQPLIDYQQQGKAFQLAIPTPDHYLPLLYSLALQENDEDVTLYNDKPVGGSLTMTSVVIA